jgi:hypothetical protein
VGVSLSVRAMGKVTRACWRRDRMFDFRHQVTRQVSEQATVPPLMPDHLPHVSKIPVESPRTDENGREQLAGDKSLLRRELSSEIAHHQPLGKTAF